MTDNQTEQYLERIQNLENLLLEFLDLFQSRPGANSIFTEIDENLTDYDVQYPVSDEVEALIHRTEIYLEDTPDYVDDPEEATGEYDYLLGLDT